jgi:HEAT repeat protein
VKARLRQLLREDKDNVVRRFIAMSMGNWADQELSADLEEALKDRDAYVKAQSLESLVKLRGSEATPIVLRELTSDNDKLRAAAVRMSATLKLRTGASTTVRIIVAWRRSSTLGANRQMQCSCWF